MKEKKKKVAVGVGIAAAVAAAIFFFLKDGVKAGDTKCLGFDLYEYSNEQWILIEANSVACGWQPGDPTFQLSDLVIEPSTINVGEPVAIGVTVTNTSEVQGTKTVVLEVT